MRRCARVGPAGAVAVHRRASVDMPSPRPPPHVPRGCDVPCHVPGAPSLRRGPAIPRGAAVTAQDQRCGGRGGGGGGWRR